MITAEQLKDVLDRTEALKRYLNIDSKLIQVEEEQLRTQAPGFWDDPKKAEVQMKKVKDLQSWIDGYRQVKALADELQLAMDFYKEELVTEQEVDDNYAKALDAVESLELKNMLREEADEMDCVLKINSGAGGTESQDWAQMLMRMYMRWGENNKYKVTVANLQEGDEAGIKQVTLEIEGPFAYGYLKGENGVHRLVRVSPYNAQGKRMTSFASVFVTPLIDDSIEEVSVEVSADDSRNELPSSVDSLIESYSSSDFGLDQSNTANKEYSSEKSIENEGSDFNPKMDVLMETPVSNANLTYYVSCDNYTHFFDSICSYFLYFFQFFLFYN